MTGSEAIIGQGTLIRGNLGGDADLIVEGRVEGGIEIRGLVDLQETARVRADVAARQIVVRGAVVGNLSASESIVLLDPARVVGDLQAPRISIAQGALYRGRIVMDATEVTPAAKHATTSLSAKHPAGAASSSSATSATRNTATRSMARRPSAMNTGAPDAAGESPATTGQRLATTPAVSSASSTARVSTRQAPGKPTRAMPGVAAKQTATTRSESPLTTPLTTPANPSGEDHDEAGEDATVNTVQQLARASAGNSARQAPQPRFSPPQSRPTMSAEPAPRTASPPVLPKPRPRVSIEDTADAASNHGPPVPVVPALKKKAKGAVRKRTAG